MNREYFRDFYYKTITPKVLEGLKLYAPYDRALFIECDNGFLIEFIEESKPLIDMMYNCPFHIYDIQNPPGPPPFVKLHDISVLYLTFGIMNVLN